MIDTKDFFRYTEDEELELMEEFTSGEFLKAVKIEIKRRIEENKKK